MANNSPSSGTIGQVLRNFVVDDVWQCFVEFCWFTESDVCEGEGWEWGGGGGVMSGSEQVIVTRGSACVSDGVYILE